MSLNLGTQIEEKIIANIIEVDHTLVYWAIMGSVKLMCISVDIDERGVVSPDVKPFMVTLLETHDVRRFQYYHDCTWFCFLLVVIICDRYTPPWILTCQGILTMKIKCTRVSWIEIEKLSLVLSTRAHLL